MRWFSISRLDKGHSHLLDFINRTIKNISKHYHFLLFLKVIDYVCLTGTTENRMIEYVDHLKEHFLNPPVMGASW